MTRIGAHLQAFTLIEMLVALTLAAMLMTAVLGLTRGLAGSVTLMDQQAPTPRHLDRVLDGLTRDLQEADDWTMGTRPDEAGVVFRGVGPLTRSTAKGPGHDPAQVVYQLLPLEHTQAVHDPAAGYALVRRQTRWLDRTSQPEESELMLVNVRSIKLLEPAATGGPDGTSVTRPLDPPPTIKTQGKPYRLVLETASHRFERVVRLEVAR